MKMIGSWGNTNFELGLYRETESENSVVLSASRSEEEQEKIYIEQDEFDEFVDCILAAVDSLAKKYPIGQVPTCIMDSKVGFIIAGWSFDETEVALEISQGSASLRIPKTYLQECLSWLIKESYLMRQSDS